MRIALAQLNPIVGDLHGNTQRVLRAIEQARAQHADLLITNELALIGYPPRDLLNRQGVVEQCEAAVAEIAQQSVGLATIVGHPRISPAGLMPFRNSASFCIDGTVQAIYDKRLFPGYDVFDEDRYFEPGEDICVVDVGGRRVGIVICEDLWRAQDASAERPYGVDPVAETMAVGCDVLACLNATPFVIGKHARHVQRLRMLAQTHATPIAAVNQAGANDDLVFDGRSSLATPDGIVASLDGWVEAVSVVDLVSGAQGSSFSAVGPDADPLQETWDALVTAVRDYVHKTGHQHVTLGLSGGIDSALTAAIAVAALGPEHVCGLQMPSEYSSRGSLDDAQASADALGMLTRVIPIRDGHEVLRRTMMNADGSLPVGLTDENIQARLRGVILMAESNATGSLVLATSNKSELAVGYSTLYGDMCGAMLVLGDLLKTQVYALARFVNRHHQALGFAVAPIPEASITKPPSAELRPDQKDQDSLPEYPVLDAIVEARIDGDIGMAEVIEQTGIDAEVVRTICAMIDRAEYKRFQAGVIPKLTPRAFGPGRPWPIVGRSPS